MSADLGIPEEAICPVCGEPMRVVRSGERARALGLQVPGGEITTIQCHDYYLTIEDEDVAQEMIKLLDAYHASREQETPQDSGVADDAPDVSRALQVSRRPL
jgi:hypothetical protein